MNKKGVVLMITLVVVSVIMIVSGAYFVSLMGEKRSVDAEKHVLQALGLAEAGAHHALSELTKRVSSDLPENVRNANYNTMANSLAGYYNGNPMQFLKDYANFQVVGSEATFTVNNSDLYKEPAKLDQYVYAAMVIVEQRQSPTRVYNPSSNSYAYTFYYKYRIEAGGYISSIIPSLSRTIALIGGAFNINASSDNFARYALFTSHHTSPSGGTVWFTANTNFTGPVHTNGRFNFANNPSGTFTDEVTQHEQKAGFYHAPGSGLLDADHYLNLDVPIWAPGHPFRRSVDNIPLPSYVQQSDLANQAAGGQNPNPWSTGVYAPYDNATDKNLVGGIYIKGNASSLTMSPGANGPVYTITTSGGTKTIAVNSNTQTTEVSGSGSGTPNGTYNGIPNGIDNTGIIVYDNGSISNFSGTVQGDTKVTVSSQSDIVISGHITYEDHNDGPPINATDFTNVLGILSWGGDVRIGTSAPNNLEIHGVIMAPHGAFEVDNYEYGNPRGIVTLLGGSITDFYGPFGKFSGDQQTHGYGRNFVYDARMLDPDKQPPYFPVMDKFNASVTPEDAFLYKKLNWQDKGN